ncbi:hypothetical protein ACIBCL_02935 [Micromonospora zamorensis]|uniref:MmyB family transcriptional regulator n=1 Tax=Micromonospora zamorensis TaxID=709883 RepID=UPI0037A86D1C
MRPTGGRTGHPAGWSALQVKRGTSPRFARLWAEHDVEERRPVVKRVPHPELGPLEFECRVLLVPETDQRMIVYVPEPGSPTHAVIRRIAERVGS